MSLLSRGGQTAKDEREGFGPGNGQRPEARQDLLAGASEQNSPEEEDWGLSGISKVSDWGVGSCRFGEEPQENLRNHGNPQQRPQRWRRGFHGEVRPPWV